MVVFVSFFGRFSMSFQNLSDFIQRRMRMSHIYQPVVLMSLLENGGTRHEQDIAKDLLSHDQSQIDYYTVIAKNMVGKVLRSHDIIGWDKDTNKFFLPDFENLTDKQREQLIGLCKEKLDDFIEQRGDSIFSHRRKSPGYISGTKRYEIMKQAKFRCELCGISAEEKALEVDHIVPRSKGGSDEMDNLQSLCYSCNAEKSNRDDTDFRDIKQIYSERKGGCPFCDPHEDRVLAEDELAFVIRDLYPVTDGHLLVIPKRHTETYFDLVRPEINALNRLLLAQKERIEKEDDSVTGFNVGINSGESAGQTVFHCHIHLIPRRNNDVDNPRGGIRGVIPNKADYQN
jgi:ATP adenylyltransferase